MATTAQPPSPAEDETPEPAPGPMHAALDHKGDDAVTAAQRLQDGLASAREVINDCVDEACDLAREGADVARQRVRARPLTAVLAAFGVGLLIGRLCR